MNECEYVFNQTAYERKRNGRGDFNKKRQGGRTIHFPSDNLSRKEKQKLNGEVSNYNLEGRVAWKVFCKWPEDIQREYYARMDQRFNPTAQMFAEAFETSAAAVIQQRRKIGCAFGKKGRKVSDVRGFHEWLYPAEKADTFKEIIESFSETEKEEEQKEPETNAAALYALLTSLAGTGAKMTIELTL